MARNVKYRVPGFRPEKQHPRKKWLIPLALFSAGLAIALILIAKWSTSTDRSQPAPIAVQQDTLEKDARFTYFRLLEDRENRVPESEISEEQRNVRLGKAATEGEYSVLIGTYKTRGMADAVRKQLVEFDALKPKMEEVTLEFASWYRLKLGPYGNLRDANQVRLFLREHGIDSIIETDVQR